MVKRFLSNTFLPQLLPPYLNCKLLSAGTVSHHCGTHWLGMSSRVSRHYCGQIKRIYWDVAASVHPKSFISSTIKAICFSLSLFSLSLIFLLFGHGQEFISRDKNFREIPTARRTAQEPKCVCVLAFWLVSYVGEVSSQRAIEAGP